MNPDAVHKIHNVQHEFELTGLLVILFTYFNLFLSNLIEDFGIGFPAEQILPFLIVTQPNLQNKQSL